MSTLAQQILLAAAVLGALAAIGKWLHLWDAINALRNLAALSTLTREFLADWRGEPARDGYEGRLSFPARMAQVEQRTASLNHDFRDDIGGRLALVEELLTIVQAQTKQLERNGGSHLADTVHRTAESVGRLEEGVLDLSHRVTDVSAKAEAVSVRAEQVAGRQEVLRAADQQLAMDLRHYVETEHADLLRANEGLRAALNEVLSIDPP